MSDKAQLTALGKSEKFNGIFSKILTNNVSLNNEEQEYILLCAILFLKVYNNDNRHRNYFKIGYYIILKYSVLFNDFRPLFEISMQIGFYPICRCIMENQLLSLNSITELVSYNIVNSKMVNSRENYLQTLEQVTTTTKLLNSEGKSLVYIAPTSFGKSSLIKDFIISNKYDRIAIIVPTKSLIVQNYLEVRELHTDYKIITHDEMYNGQQKFIAVLTQERAARLLRKNIYFDIMFIDEAHNIFRYNSNKGRSILLARIIEINRNAVNNKVVYLSPLIDDPKNLKMTNGINSTSALILHNLKSEELFLLENGCLYQYNRFAGIYILIRQRQEFFKYILSNSLHKNFIYHHRPVIIEKIAFILFQRIKDIESCAELELILSTLTNEVHQKFNAIKYLKKGIVYIHGKMPNQIKEYLESKFKTCSSIRYIVANKVILEGVNLPIETIFITSTSYLDGKELTNLIGRVNRLSYVFKEQDLSKLLPKIHFLNEPEYQGNYSMRNKIELLRNHSFKDVVENPLLNSYDIDKLVFSKTDWLTKEEVKEKRRIKDKSIIENTILLTDREEQTDYTSLKKYFVINGFEDLFSDIDALCRNILSKVEAIKTNLLRWKENNLVEMVVFLFISNMDNIVIDYELERLKNQAAQNYYHTFLTYTQKQSLKYNITSTFQYLKTKAKSDDPQLYIGESYGEIVRFSAIYKNNAYQNKVYVSLIKKTDDELINLSIIKLKIEEDFISYKLNKLITFLKDYELISESEYLLHTYGTDDLKVITLIRLGLPPSTVHKIRSDNQDRNLDIDITGRLVTNTIFDSYLNSQNDLFQFEIKKFL